MTLNEMEAVKSPPVMPDPSGIMALATGYWNSAALLAAVKLRLFDVIAEGPNSAAWTAKCLGSDERATTMLLDACAGLGLIVKNCDADVPIYENTPASQMFLVYGKSGYMGSAILWSADQYEAWGSLAQTVQTGKPSVSPSLHLGSDLDQTRTFVIGMNNRAKGIARGVVGFLDFDGCKSLLDVGGGPGAYSVLLAEKYPDLHPTVMDLPGIVAVARELVSQSASGSRVTLLPGDATTDSYGESAFDAILFSGVLHQMSPETIGHMLQNARRALKPGGRVVICDVMLDATKTQPAFAALFSVQMLLTSAEGAVFSGEECLSWLINEGFERVASRQLPPPLPYTIVSGFLP